MALMVWPTSYREIVFPRSYISTKPLPLAATKAPSGEMAKSSTAGSERRSSRPVRALRTDSPWGVGGGVDGNSSGGKKQSHP